jgi:hypothetical protein
MQDIRRPVAARATLVRFEIAAAGHAPVIVVAANEAGALHWCSDPRITSRAQPNATKARAQNMPVRALRVATIARPPCRASVNWGGRLQIEPQKHTGQALAWKRATARLRPAPDARGVGSSVAQLIPGRVLAVRPSASAPRAGVAAVAARGCISKVRGLRRGLSVSNKNRKVGPRKASCQTRQTVFA